LSKRIQVLAWTGWRLNRRSGKPIGSIRKAWQTATEKATIPWLRPHDLRRSAARNLLRSGEDSRQREVATETSQDIQDVEGIAEAVLGDGATPQNRTGDTVIFSCSRELQPNTPISATPDQLKLSRTDRSRYEEA
jgi:hypothetical protein